MSCDQRTGKCNCDVYFNHATKERSLKDRYNHRTCDGCPSLQYLDPDTRQCVRKYSPFTSNSSLSYADKRPVLQLYVIPFFGCISQLLYSQLGHMRPIWKSPLPANFLTKLPMGPQWQYHQKMFFGLNAYTRVNFGIWGLRTSLVIPYILWGSWVQKSAGKKGFFQIKLIALNII